MSTTGKPKGATSSSGIPIKPIYTPEDVKGPHQERIGEPGKYPYTRSLHPTPYSQRLWTFRQYSGLAAAEDTNQRYKFLLSQGQTGLSVAMDLPSQIGYDSDDPLAEDEVGRVGVAISSLKDMELIFDGISLADVSTSFTINGTAAATLAMYFAVAEKQGVPLAKVRGTIQNDILKEYVARGTWIFPPEPSLRLIADSIEYCARHAPKFNSISIAGAHFHDAGASTVQELAFTLADGITYVDWTRRRGIPVDEFAPQLSFFFYTHNDFFEEIAKYRAGRRLWAKIMKERFGAKDPRSWMFRAGVVCGGSMLTAQQPHNNIVRVAYQAMASVLGGVQSVFTAAWDEAYTIPSEETAELALRTQQVLAYETGVANVVDPLGGSYYVESLTDAVEREAAKLIEDIDARGGMVPCIEKGYIQSLIARRAYEEQRKIESGEKVIVGVNKFAREETPPEIASYDVPEDAKRRHLERLNRVRKERDQAKAKAALAALERAARGAENTMPYLMDAVKAYCTMGEIYGTLRGVFGTFKEPVMQL
ncbi:MAG: methylmalonyl-CoA mutase family protein [Dehalococcoidia bacterium]|nr:methylmalonyl-CoA mutase family protein [Dehalococcoidia bacterium]